MKNNIIRWTATVIMLVVVWMHAHWSVALCLTNLSVCVELLTWAVARLTNAVRQVDGLLKRLK